jgi:hypothetical protein
MKRSALLAVFAALALESTAHADRLTVARAQPLIETSHSVELTIDGDVARYKVRRTFANSGTRSEEASVRIQLAHGAAVTGLRIRARDRWYDGELMDAEEARQKYQELTGIGSAVAKDPALLQWVWADRVHLQVFPVLPGSVNTVEYTLTAPLEYRDGRYIVTYPHVEQAEDSLALADPVIRVNPGHGDARTDVFVAGRRVAPNEPVVVLPPPPLPWVGDGEASPDASYVFSKVSIDRSELVNSATVDLEIDHTFSGDLTVTLVTPAGEHLPVTDGKGGENDIRGRFEVELPVGLSSQGDWHLVVSDHAGLDIGTLDAWSLALVPTVAAAKIEQAAADLPRFIPDAPGGEGAAGHVMIEVAAPKIRHLDARLGRVVASDAHGFARLEIDAAPRIGELPRKASVVFVVDASRSVDEEHLATQLRIAQAYLSHVPDASVELVAFDRAARRVFGEFVAAAEFAPALAKAQQAGKLALHNGSAIDAGLGLAGELLAARRGPTRIVALTDARLRTRFANSLADQALAAAPAATVTHVVIPEEGGPALLRRDDAHVLAPIAGRHHGVLFSAFAPADDKAVAGEMLGLVRPIGIDYFKIRGIDLAGAEEVPEVLREGAAYRAMQATPDPTRRVVLSGKIWAAPFRRVVGNTESFDIATAAFVFSEDEHHDLSEDEMRVVAYRGRAVSPVTSYLAVEPGVRPAVDGLEVGLGNVGLIGRGGGGGGSGMGSLGIARPPPSFAKLLADDITRCARTHVPTGSWSVELAVETTSLEIVDVEAKQASHPAMRTCLVEATWALDLPLADWPERETYRVTLP